MTEKMRESLSALMDDEANELEVERVLSHIGEDGDLRRTWVRYNAVRACMSGQQAARLDLDISARVRDAIDAPEEGAKAAASGTGVERIRQRYLRPLASFAVAASVAATVVIGGQQLAQLGGTELPGSGVSGSSQAVAASASPVGLVNSLGATSVRASYGTRAVPVMEPAAQAAYRELARQRMQQYMQEHAEHAALNTPQGLIPFARVPQIRE
jgi:sigma-E factor negative regulatory protein RseA